ncbi:MAG: glycosyltransferase family 2 protein [Gammaproteobacteria bacterium]
MSTPNAGHVPPLTLLSVVAPARDEQDVLVEFHARLTPVLDSLTANWEIIYVNDGSTDSTLALMESLHATDARVAIVDLSRSFGKEIALSAGLDHARGDAVIVIDTDLQDPPELIPELIQQWQSGHDVVYAQRRTRAGESMLRCATAHVFYRLLQHAGRVQVPIDTGDFRLLSRRAVDALKQLREQHRYMKGLFAWIGYPQIAVPYEREARFAGQTKWNYRALVHLAMEGITSFTTRPLRLATYLGLISAAVAFVYGTVMIVKTLIYGNAVPGYPSLMVVVLFLGGVQLVAIGIMGEYLGRMFDESKQRPLYFVKRYIPAAHAKDARA